MIKNAVKPSVKRTISLEEFRQACKVQGASRSKDVVFKCVSCGNLQSQEGFMKWFDMSEEEAAKYAHFSCA